MQKIFLVIVIILISVGCSSKQLYTLGDTSSIKPTFKENKKFIAVEKIELPIYMMDSPIYRKNSKYHLEKIDKANWISSMDEHLTNVLISYLQKSMNNPNIYTYPWSNIEKVDKKVSVTISSFISYKNVVTLEANYQILDKAKNKTSNYLFNTKESFHGKSVEYMIEA
ncbi:MAG: membrane integrity-associated transporter subunit PqiC, partial [Sulfurovaceae bacterium]|nr:membrane integrity-associated transporter subunit PqiC [Sulfurovaceae bacterium]